MAGLLAASLVFLCGCRFEAFFHSIEEDRGAAASEEAIPETSSAADPVTTEVMTEVTTEAPTEPTTVEPPHLSFIDIYELFRVGESIAQDTATKQVRSQDTILTVKKVNYRYTACTGFIARSGIDAFFYSGAAAYGDNEFVAYVYEFPEVGSVNLLRRKPLLLAGDRYTYRWSPDCGAIRIVFAFTSASVIDNRQDLTDEILRESFRISPADEKDLYAQEHADSPESLRFASCDTERNTNPGVANVLARARQAATIQYELQGALPAQVSGWLIPEKDVDGNPMKLIGLPYSSARSNDKMLYLNVSAYTFLTAVHNPRSVIYRKTVESSNAETFYGTVCSVFTDYTQGLMMNLPTQYLNSERFSRAYYRKATEDMSLGDVFINSNHSILITEIYRNPEGEIAAVEYTHAMPPMISVVCATVSKFMTMVEEKGYACFGYKGISQVPYEPIPYVAAKEGEVAEPIDYPDIMCEFGDKAVLMGGASTAADFERQVTINVLNKEDYYAIQVYRDSAHPIDFERDRYDYELLETRSTVTDFVMGDPETGLIPGAYKIVMRGVDKTSTTEFFVVDASCVYENGVLYWKCGNAEADTVSIYTDYPAGEPVILTRGNVKRSDRPDFDYCMDLNQKRAETEARKGSSYPNAKITFRTPYGTATWYSYFNSAWVGQPVG